MKENKPKIRRKGWFSENKDKALSSLIKTEKERVQIYKLKMIKGKNH